jgi:hypothetical protein
VRRDDADRIRSHAAAFALVAYGSAVAGGTPEAAPPMVQKITGRHPPVHR